jgi:GST-like protein
MAEGMRAVVRDAFKRLKLHRLEANIQLATRPRSRSRKPAGLPSRATRRVISRSPGAGATTNAGRSAPTEGSKRMTPDLYTLYGTRGSGSAAVEIALRTCGVQYIKVHASSWESDSAVAELARVNPLKQIPTLVLPDGSTMSESAAILMHLGLVHAESGLLPVGASARARVLRGLVYIAANCYSAISVLDYPERWTTATDPASLDAIRAGTRARLHRHWEIFADVFGGEGAYLGGEFPGALDYLAVVVSRWSGTRAHLQAARPAFFATLQRIEELPTVASVCAEHWPPTS